MTQQETYRPRGRQPRNILSRGRGQGCQVILDTGRSLGWVLSVHRPCGPCAPGGKPEAPRSEPILPKRTPSSSSFSRLHSFPHPLEGSHSGLAKVLSDKEGHDLPGPRFLPSCWSVRRNWLLSFQSFLDWDSKYLHFLSAWGWESREGGSGYAVAGNRERFRARWVIPVSQCAQEGSWV